MKAVQQKYFVILAISFMLCLAGLVMTSTSFAERCVDNGDGTVTDNDTMLMWQKATAGSMNWDSAKNYASSLSLGDHSDWRLPSKDELVGLTYSPCRDMMDERDDHYWSSSYDRTSYPNFNISDDIEPWTVWFGGGPNQGEKYFAPTATWVWVRAVRSAQ